MGVMMDNTWLHFEMYATCGESWRDDNNVRRDDIRCNLSKTFVETGISRETSPDGEQMIIEIPWFGRESGYIESTETLFAIRDDNGDVWIMALQIEMMV